jgi:hypothetical protein
MRDHILNVIPAGVMSVGYRSDISFWVAEFRRSPRDGIDTRAENMTVISADTRGIYIIHVGISI